MCTLVNPFPSYHGRQGGLPLFLVGFKPLFSAHLLHKGFEAKAHPDPNQKFKAHQFRFVVHDEDIIVSHVRIMNDVILDPAVKLCNSITSGGRPQRAWPGIRPWFLF